MQASESRELLKETVHGPLEKHLREEALHYNLYEHKLSPLQFILRVALFGILGVVLGGLINALMRVIHNGSSNRWVCSGFVAIQIVVIAALFAIASLLIGSSIDDWVMATWTGFLFALTFFASQSTLNQNIQCAVGN